MIRTGLMAGLLAMTAGAALAQPLTADAVKPMLFAPGGAEVEMIPNKFLPADQAAILKQVGAVQPYYGAIAVSPDEGIMVEATVAAANHHNTDAAKVAALAGCEAKRKGKSPCAIVALIRPKGWTARPFQLSSGATSGFLDDYSKIRRDRAFAMSPATGLWGLGKGKDAASKAVSDCMAKGPARDCAVAIVD